MANDEKTKLLDEAEKLLTDIALNKSGITSEHVERAVEFVAKAKHAKREAVLAIAA